jgi:hypothetical protein
MTEKEPLVRWRSVGAGSGRMVADLPNDCYASIEFWSDGIYYVMIGCDGQHPILLVDQLAERAVAQAWVEDKAQLLTRGIDIARLQRG